MSWGGNSLIPSYTKPSNSPTVLGDIGPGGGVDLSFLTSPDNPYVQALGAYLAPQPVYNDPGNGGYVDQGGGGGDLSFLSDPANPYVQALQQRPVLESSPEWQAYLNALGLEKKQFAADIARQESQAKAAAAFQVAGLAPQYDQQRRGITGNEESRGMSRSGEFQRRLAENRATQGRQTTGINQALQSTVGNLEGALANKNVELDAQQQQQRASMLAAGYQPFDFGALDRYMKSLQPGPTGLSTNQYDQLGAYLKSVGG